MAVAAVLILVVAGTYLFTTSNHSPSSLAAKYTKENFATLSQTMSGDAGEMESGIAAYNNKDYKKALEIFKSVY